jgi:hypothetical protein
LDSSEHLEPSTSSRLLQQSVFTGLLFLCRTTGNFPFKDARAKADRRYAAWDESTAACVGLKPSTVSTWPSQLSQAGEPLCRLPEHCIQPLRRWFIEGGQSPPSLFCHAANSPTACCVVNTHEGVFPYGHCNNDTYPDTPGRCL